MQESVREMLAIYFIGGTQDTEDLPGVLKEGLEAGVTCFQFREKGPGSLEGDQDKVEEMARICQSLCESYRVPFIVNDSVELAVKLQADGIHVGQGDRPVSEVRRQVGPNMVIGLSTNTFAEYKDADANTEIAYVGIGPAFLPQSKKDHEEVMGLFKIKEARDWSKRLPAVAIGGITVENAADVWETGVDGLAVISTLTRSKDVKETVSQLKKQRV